MSDSLKSILRSLGYYKLKHSDSVGWWVDGQWGYSVTGYHDTQEEALTTAITKIKQAQKDGCYPAWRLA